MLARRGGVDTIVERQALVAAMRDNVGNRGTRDAHVFEEIVGHAVKLAAGSPQGDRAEEPGQRPWGEPD